MEYEMMKAFFISGTKWQLDNMWIEVESGLPIIDIPVFVLTKNGSIAVSKMYIPKDCYGNVLGDKEWKGSNSFGESIIAWMYKPKFKKGEQHGQ